MLAANSSWLKQSYTAVVVYLSEYKNEWFCIIK